MKKVLVNIAFPFAIFLVVGISGTISDWVFIKMFEHLDESSLLTKFFVCTFEIPVAFGCYYSFNTVVCKTASSLCSWSWLASVLIGIFFFISPALLKGMIGMNIPDYSGFRFFLFCVHGALTLILPIIYTIASHEFIYSEKD